MLLYCTVQLSTSMGDERRKVKGISVTVTVILFVEIKFTLNNGVQKNCTVVRW